MRAAVILLLMGAVFAWGATYHTVSAGVAGGTDNVPLYVNYQGYLTDSLGVPLTATTTMIFTIWSDSGAGSNLWSVTQSVPVERGVFSVKLALGSGDTTIFMSGARRWLELTVNGHLMKPRTEMTTMAYGFYSLNSDLLDSRHATGFIWNNGRLSQQPSADFWISGSGWVEGQLLAHASGLTSSAGVFAQVGANNMGVYSSSQNGIAVYGSSAGQNGVYGTTTVDTAFGVRAANTHQWGTAIAGSGANDTLVYLLGGSGGAFSAKHAGIFAFAHDTTGTGICTNGNRIKDTVYLLAEGAGGAFNGTTVGVYGCARDSLNSRQAGGFFRTFGLDSCWAYVGMVQGGTRHGVMSNGDYDQVFKTKDGNRVMSASMSTTPRLEDFGRGQLVDGHCRVNLDPTFLTCAAVTRDEPIQVFITLNDDCRGVYVRTDERGFDVYELQSGTSNARFDYRVVALPLGTDNSRMPLAPSLPRTAKAGIGSAAAPTPPAH